MSACARRVDRALGSVYGPGVRQPSVPTRPFPAARRPAQARRAPLLPALLLLVAACGPGAGEAQDGGSTERPSPVAWTPVSIDEFAFDVIAAFQRGEAAVLAENAARPLWCGPPVLPGSTEADEHESRLVISARPESAFEVELPPLAPGARLLASTFVFPALDADAVASDPVPATFRILVDGEVRATVRSDYVLDGSVEHPLDRMLRRLEVELPTGAPVRVTFETTRLGAPIPAGVTLAECAWWEIHVRHRRDVPRQRASPEHPNLLVLTVDTLAARRMSLHDYDRDTTPALVRFADAGTVFTAASSASAWTIPATASLFTGVPPTTHGVLGGKRSYLMDELGTWPARIARLGMAGAAFVANPLVAAGVGFDRGFERFDAVDQLDADELNGRLLDWLDTQPDGGRWFAYLHYMDPHAPYDAPAPQRTRYVAPGFEETRDFARLHPRDVNHQAIDPLTEAERRHLGDLYDGEVVWFDTCFAKLMDDLRERGLLDDTVVLLTADHGEEFFEHGQVGHGFSLYEELLHVPLLLVGPGIPGGRRVDTPVSTAAVCNTLLALAGAEPLELSSAAPALLPVDEAERRADLVCAITRTELFGGTRILVSARDPGGRKVVCTLDGDETLVSAEVFDLAVDPEEQHPLADDAEREALVETALRWYRETSALRDVGPREEVELTEALRGVGYVGDDR